MGDATGCSTDESGRGLPNFILDDESLQQLLHTSGSQPFSGVELGPPQYTTPGASPCLLPSPPPNQLPAMGHESNMQPGLQPDVSMYSTDLDDPECLIGFDGTPNTGKIEKAKESLQEYGFTTNFKDEGECPKSTPETYCQSKGMLVQPSDVHKTETARRVVLFTSKEIPVGWRIRIVMLSNNKDEVHKPIKSCRNHEIPWIGNTVLEHYILPTKEYMVSCVYHHGHPVLVVPEEYFQKRRETHCVTGEEGYSYIGKFFFPCNTFHLKPKKQKSVKLVAGLEVPTYQGWYHCAGLTTVDVRVCGSPGRDKMATTDRKTGKGKQEVEDVCSSDGDEPPTRKKKKKMATDTSEAVGSSSGVSSTGPPAPEGGVSSEGEHTGATSLLHEMQMQLEAERKEREKTFLEEMERYREIRAEEREKDKLMFEEVLRKWLTEERGACFHGKQPPAF